MTGRQLKLLRQSKDIKIRQVSEAIELSISMISKVENNERKLNEADQLKYIQFLEDYEVQY